MNNYEPEILIDEIKVKVNTYIDSDHYHITADVTVWPPIGELKIHTMRWLVRPHDMESVFDFLWKKVGNQVKESIMLNKVEKDKK